MKLCTYIASIAFVLIHTHAAYAWDGFDYESGSYVEIEKGNLVRPGETIEMYDYGAGEYRDVDVQSIERSGNSVEVEVYDPDSGESRTLEMDD